VFLNRQLGVTIYRTKILIKILKVIKFATSKKIFFKSAMFPHRNMHKYTLVSPDGKTQNQKDILMLQSVPLQARGAQRFPGS